jgi:DNA-binding IclR family transcriptional regulator
MRRSSGRPSVDAQKFTDVEAGVYEAIATLEFSGRPVTVAEVASVTGLDIETADAIVRALAEQGVLARSGPDDGVFRLARRDWSATPETPSR